MRVIRRYPRISLSPFPAVVKNILARLPVGKDSRRMSPRVFQMGRDICECKGVRYRMLCRGWFSLYVGHRASPQIWRPIQFPRELKMIKIFFFYFLYSLHFLFSNVFWIVTIFKNFLTIGKNKTIFKVMLDCRQCYLKTLFWSRFLLKILVLFGKIEILFETWRLVLNSTLECVHFRCFFEATFAFT